MSSKAKYKILKDKLRYIAEQNEDLSQLRLDWPARWWHDPTWRCCNDHVIKRQFEENYNICRICFEPFCITFPEDVEGPLNLDFIYERKTK